MDAKKYYSLESKNDVADLYIFGDITSWPWLESDVSASGIVNELQSFLKSEAVVQESTIPCKAEEEDSSMACKEVYVIQRHLRPYGQLQYKKKIQREQNDSNL